MTARQGWSPATVLGAISIVSGLVTFGAATFIAMGKDTRADYQDHDRRITRAEGRIDANGDRINEVSDRLRALENRRR